MVWFMTWCVKPESGTNDACCDPVVKDDGLRGLEFGTTLDVNYQ